MTSIYDTVPEPQFSGKIGSQSAPSTKMVNFIPRKFFTYRIISELIALIKIFHMKQSNFENIEWFISYAVKLKKKNRLHGKRYNSGII